MKHDHLPALKRYTSQIQYEALQSIEETKSIKDLVFSGSSSRTLGSLVRSGWINTFSYTQDGVQHEGWGITDAGKHAMALFAEKLRIHEEEDAKHMARFNAYRACVFEAYTLDRNTRARREELDLEWKKLNSALEEANQKVKVAGTWLSHADQQQVLRFVLQDLRKESNDRPNAG
jgi:hypothetical protein